jgi:hypothetical protein
MVQKLAGHVIGLLVGQGPMGILGRVHAWGFGRMGENGEYMLAGRGRLGLLHDPGLVSVDFNSLVAAAASRMHSLVQGRGCARRPQGVRRIRHRRRLGSGRRSRSSKTTSMAVLSFKSPVQVAVRAGGIPRPRGGAE